MKRILMLAALVLAGPAGLASEPGQMNRNDSVRDKPFTSGKVVAPVKSGQSLDIQKREGSWYFVTVNGKTGWVPMLSVRRAKTAAGSSAGSLSKTATGRSASGGVVSTTGVRGLNEEQLKTAAFDERAVATVEKNRATPADAAAFARAGGVQTRVVPSLPGTTGLGGLK